jgi:hypothetical protein
LGQAFTHKIYPVRFELDRVLFILFNHGGTSIMLGSFALICILLVA